MNIIQIIQGFLGTVPNDVCLKYEYICGAILLILYNWGLIAMLLNFQKSFSRRAN